MALYVEKDGLLIHQEGEHRFEAFRGDVGARAARQYEFGDVVLQRIDEDGKKFTLYLPLADAYTIADALDAVLDFVETHRAPAVPDEH